MRQMCVGVVAKMGEKVLACLVIALVFVCCGQRHDKGAIADMEQPVNLVEEAQLLRIYDGGDYFRVEVVNPWDTAAMLGRYLLVERGVVPDSLPTGDFTMVEVPLQKSLVYSSVHAGIVDEMGKADAVAGVADGRYFNKPPFADRIRRGGIVDVGSSMSPSMEAIMALRPDAILVSPFENAGHGVLEQTGIPVIECADYMESTPKGRAEWVRFLGLLYGCREVADSIYGAVTHAYDAIKARVAQSDVRPLVLTEMLTDGYWFVPGGGSYMARLLQDAGARYPWGNDGSTGSLQLDFSSVYAKAADADFWLVKTYGHDLTLDDMRSVYLLNSQFKAFKEGNVYVANTADAPLFEEFPFHPEKLLEEYAMIFHPELAGGRLRYFHRAR